MSSPRGSRLSFLAHVFFCTKGCQVTNTYTTYPYDSSPSDERVEQAAYWRCCEVGTKLREWALKEEPEND